MTVYQELMQWLGVLFGAAGAWTLGRNPKNEMARKLEKISGFMFFFVSNLFWIAFALTIGTWGLLVMQLIFVVTSVRGIVNGYREFLHDR